jgi:hypothetical protein
MLVVLFEYLAGFGAIDVAYLPPRPSVFYLGWNAIRGQFGAPFSHVEGLKYVRLTPLGAYLLGLTPEYAGAPAPQGPPLRVLPNQQIVLTTRLPGAHEGHPVLSKFCGKISDDVYQLAPERLLKTIESDEMSAAQIAAYLERESGTALPQTVHVLLKDVEKKSGLIEAHGDALVFRVRDNMLAMQLEHDRTLHKLGCRRAGADWIVVPRAKASAFRKRVRELGFGVRPLTR